MGIRRHAIDCVVSRFADHDVVIIGEHHRVAQETQFVRDFIPAVYHRAGVRRLLTAPTFDRSLTKRLLANMGIFWLCEEYMEIHEMAWKLNRGLAPGQPPFRILLAVPPRRAAE